MKSTNNIILSGRLTADAQPMANESGARFSIAHNMGKDKAPLFVEFVQFAKNGRFTNKIDFDLLKKGTPVLVHAFMRPDSYTNAEGKTINKIQYVVKKVEAITAEEAEQADEQDE